MILKTADELWAEHGNGAYSFKYVRLTGDRFRFVRDGFSMTLKLGPMEGDQELIERFLAGNSA